MWIRSWSSSSKEHVVQSTSLNTVPFSSLPPTLYYHPEVRTMLLAWQLPNPLETGHQTVYHGVWPLWNLCLYEHTHQSPLRETRSTSAFQIAHACILLAEAKSHLDPEQKGSWENMVLCLPSPCDPEGSREKDGNRSWGPRGKYLALFSTLKEFTETRDLPLSFHNYSLKSLNF